MRTDHKKNDWLGRFICSPFWRIIARVLVLLMLFQAVPLWEQKQTYEWNPEKFFENLYDAFRLLGPKEAHAGVKTVFGPKKYVRTTGKPDVYQDTFSTTAGPAQIIILNGEKSGQNRVSSAIISFNRKQIYGPSDFNQNVYRLEKSIELSQTNTLRVELRSQPKSYLRIEIVVPTSNQPPIANAGQDQDVIVGSLVTLDGRNSSDPDGDLITYGWTIVEAPSESIANLNNPTSVMPTFTPDIPGEYRFSLIVNDGQADSAPDEVIIIAAMPNVAPTANAGPDQSVVTGSTVFLDGSGSFDPDGDSLTYQWQILSSPEGSTASLDDPSSATPAFLADKAGQYTILLTVNDGELDSLPDDVVVISAIPNAPPVSYAGDDQTVSKNTTIQLDGRGSSDPNNDPLTYSWTIVSRPAGSTSDLNNPASPTPQILADKAGDYVFTLIVYDGQLYSNPDTVVVMVGNDPPIAEAGPDQYGLVGVPINLNGSASSDPNGDTLTYQWTIDSAPSGSTAVIGSPTSGTSTITPDIPGVYVIQLVVNDGSTNSSPDTVTLTVRVRVPDVVGQPQASAQAVIIAEGLTVGAITQVYNALVPLGHVISQNPAGGTLALAGSPVSLTISLGPAPVLVPNVVGMTQSAAETAIQAAGLQVGTVTTANSPTVPAGSVISQNPAAGASVPAGSSVSLVVSIGPVQVTVPNVVGMTQASAQTAITGAGLTVGTITTANSDTVTAGNVISQNPSAGLSVAQGSAVDLVISLGPSGLPPDPASVAPPLDPTVATTMAKATEFLYTGANRIQTGVAPGTIDAKRVAVLRGKVLDSNNNPLYGVIITILNHPEFGQTLSRLDGMFDIAVNGGGYLTVNYQKSGYLSAQRQINVPWKDYAWLPDVILIQLDNQVTTVDLTSNEPIQVARGSVVTDEDGTRQATLLIPQGTQAQMVFPDGSTQPLTSLSVRITEYTIGPNGPKAMPAELPPTSGYTYAFELSADEAILAGATSVRFNQPLSFYVEDFIGFPVGSAVPTGYYDRQKGQWVASNNGRVLRILGITGGLADIDTNGDSIADDVTTLASLNITDAERQRLAILYPQTPSQLWRVPITHFTQPWDCNWPYGLPPGAIEPKTPGPKTEKKDELKHETGKNSTCSHSGSSSVECQSQTIGESIPVVGTPFTLNYRSDRQWGRTSARTITIPLFKRGGDGVWAVPCSGGASCAITLWIFIAGRKFVSSWYDYAPLQTTFTWDGLDAYGRPVQGSQLLSYQLIYAYPAYYYPVPADFENSFAGVSPSTEVVPSRSNSTISLRQTFHGYIGVPDFRLTGLGGWTTDVHHLYDPTDQTLYMGDGSQRTGSGGINTIISTVAGNGEIGYSGDGGPATQAMLMGSMDVVVGPDGSIYIADTSNDRIRKVGPDGIIATVAGNGLRGFAGDGGPATNAQLWRPIGLALGPDGSIYIADSINNRIRRVGPDGIITTVAGNGMDGYSGDGGPATDTSIYSPYDVAIGPDGSIYIADSYNNRIRRVGPDGIITTVAGNGWWYYGGDGGPAKDASIYSPLGVDVDRDGSIYISDSGNFRIRRVGPDGIITTIAGNGQSDYGGDGGPATDASFKFPWSVAIGPSGSIYIGDNTDNRIRMVGPAGIIATVAGNGTFGYSGDGSPATQARLWAPLGIAVGPDGSLYIADGVNNRIRKVGSILAKFLIAELAIPSRDSSELYVFNLSGRHLRTLNALTGAVIYQFAYDSAGLLTTITDGDGNVTTIERDAGSNPIAIVGPFGQRTTLSVNANGYLESVINPANEAYAFTYSDDGLLTSVTDPRNNTSTYQYDDLGYLVRTDDPAGGFQTLTRTTFLNGYEVARTTALGRTTKYLVERLSTGGQRLVNTFPDGGITETIVGTDGSETITYPDGTVITLQYGPDPRFGMQSPVTTSTTFRTSGGLSSVIQNNRTATFSDPSDPLSITTLTKTTDVNGRVYASTLDATARRMTFTDPEGRQTVANIDEKGRLTSAQLTGLAASGYSYDVRGRISTITQGTRTYSLNYNLAPTDDGLLDSITDPESATLSFRQYDGAGRLRLAALPDSNQVSFDYDRRGNLTSLTPPGRPVHTFTHNPVNLMQQYIPPDVGTGLNRTVYDYNSDRQLEKVTRPDGKVVESVYDSATGRIEKISILEGTVELEGVSFSYYPAGQPSARKLASITAVDGGTIQFTYDGSLLTGVTWTGAVSGSVAYEYNNNFQVTSETVNGSDPISFIYDQDGLLSQAGALVLHRDDPARPETKNGLLRGTTLSNVTTAMDYNEFGELKDFSASFNSPTGPVTLFESHYPVRDKLGRIKEKTETVLGVTKTYQYEYDARGRLWKVFENGVLLRQYDYDANGNRLLFKADGSPDTEYDNQDRLLRYGNVTYTYADNGELKTKTDASGQTNYTYDVFGNLTHVDLLNGTAIDYVIDGTNRRIGKKVNGSLLQGLLYRGMLKPLAELDGAGNLVSRFVYGSWPNVPEYIVKGGVTYRMITDHLGSPRIVVDAATGDVVQRIDYDEFGYVVTDTNPGFQPFGYGGGLYDNHTKLTRFGFRDYDAFIGRWTAKDPLLHFGGDTNLYGYVKKDPINMVDMSGMQGSSHLVCVPNVREINMGIGFWEEFWIILVHFVTFGYVRPEQSPACYNPDDVPGSPNYVPLPPTQPYWKPEDYLNPLELEMGKDIIDEALKAGRPVHPCLMKLQYYKTHPLAPENKAVRF